MLVDVGELDEADRLLEEHALNWPIGSGPTLTQLLEARGRPRLAQKRTEQGIEDLEDAWKRLGHAGDARPDVRGRVALSLCPTLAQADRQDAARAIASEALRLARAYRTPRLIARSMHADALVHRGGADIEQLQQQQQSTSASAHRSISLVPSWTSAQRSDAAANPPPLATHYAVRSTSREPAELIPCRARRARAARRGRPPAPRPHHRQRRTHRQRTTHRATRDPGNDQPTNRRGASRHPKNGREPPRADLPQLGIHARSELSQALAPEGQLTAVE